MGPDKKLLLSFTVDLSGVLTVKFGDPSTFVGLEIGRHEDGSITLTQRNYIRTLIQRFDMAEAIEASVPMQPTTALVPHNGETPGLPFREIIGSLLFIARCTRPDIAFAVSKLSQFLNGYDVSHWKEAKNILRYLKGTPDMGITYPSKLRLENKGNRGCHSVLTGYSDSDYAGDKISRKSTTGHVFLLNDSPVSWTSQKQPVVACSSTEAEYIALASAAREAVWMRRFLADIGAVPDLPTVIKVDNQSAIKLANNPEFHQRFKHIEVRFHLTRDLVEKKEITIEYVSTTQQKADILTKPMLKSKFATCRQLVGIEDVRFAKVMKIEDLGKCGTGRETLSTKEEKGPTKTKKANNDSLSDPVKREGDLQTARAEGKDVGTGTSSPAAARAKKGTRKGKWDPQMLTATVLIALLLLPICIGMHLQPTQPVLWSQSKKPVTQGQNRVHLFFKFTNPCGMLTTDSIHPDVLPAAKLRCEEAYERLFVAEMERMCPNQETTVTHHISKRFIFIIGIIVASIVTTVGLGTAALVTSIQAKREVGTINDIVKSHSTRLDAAEERLHLHRRALEELTALTAGISKDLTELKEKQADTNFLISSITGRLLIGNHVIKEASRRWWTQKRLYSPFLDYFNFTLPCGASCPLEFGTPQGCHMTYDRKGLLMTFLLPVINPNLKLVEADPFVLMHRTRNQTCTIKYTGPRHAIASMKDDCVFASNQRNIQRDDIILAPESGCSGSSALSSTSKFFTVDRCDPTHPHDERDFVQIKAFAGTNYVYCSGSEITVDGRPQPCPDAVFTLPQSVSFKVNDYSYKGAMMDLTHEEQLNPLFTLRTNWHLQPILNMTSLLTLKGLLDQDEKLEKAAQPSTGHRDYWTSNYWVGILTGILFLGITSTATWIGFKYIKVRKASPTIKISACRVQAALEEGERADDTADVKRGEARD